MPFKRKKRLFEINFEPIGGGRRPNAPPPFESATGYSRSDSETENVDGSDQDVWIHVRLCVVYSLHERECSV